MSWKDTKRELLYSFFEALNPKDKDEWLLARRACDTSLFYFIKDVGGYMPKSGGDISEDIHKPICDALQDPKVDRFFYFMPRSWKKSTIRCWFNLWDYLQNNEIRILIPSEKEEKASEWLGFIRDQVRRNARLRWVYPELTAIDDSYTRQNPWSTKRLLFPRDGVYPEATMNIIGIRGGAQGGHYDIITPDDLIGEKGMESPLVLEDAFRWFDNIEGLLIEKDKTRKDSSKIKGTGTHWALGDLGSYIQEKYQEYEWIIVPCVKDITLQNAANITWLQHPTAENGESNWPEMFPTKVFTEMMDNPEQEMTFWAQYMNNPKKSDLNKLDLEWLKYYDWIEEDGERCLKCLDDGKVFRLSELVQHGMLDPGGFTDTKMTKGSSRNAIVVGGQAVNSEKKFVTYTWAGRGGKYKEPEEVFKKFVEADRDVKPYIWHQEIFGQQRYILEDFKARVKKAKLPIRIIPLESDERKDAKDLNISALATPAARGEIYVHRSMRELIAEWTRWPNGITKDVLDMVAKLNQYFWHRGRRADLDRMNSEVMDSPRPQSAAGY